MKTSRVHPQIQDGNQDLAICCWQSDRILYNMMTDTYFGRTYDKKEIDLVEEQRGNLCGYEIKGKNISPKVPKDWRENYPDAGFKVIHRGNYLRFIQ